MRSSFTKNLLRWNEVSNTRIMPWKGEKDPYKIWISEIILQQTRVEQGLKYYQKFITTFPDVCSLANAPEQQVFKMWEGLGYYSRCKNLLTTARVICSELKGIFPSAYENIRALKGIGSYTAAAVSSFAFNLPYAVVDGNVMRVMSRYFGLDTPVDTNEGKKLYTQLADTLLDEEKPGLYNQAIMDFGAVICKPQQPACSVCVQQSGCRAFNEQRTGQLPVKKKALVKKSRWIYYFIIEHEGKVYIRKRTQKDIWENLYEFVLQENESPFFFDDAASVQESLERILGNNNFSIRHVSAEHRQLLTHQTITGKFVEAITYTSPPSLSSYELVNRDALALYPFPKFITQYL